MTGQTPPVHPDDMPDGWQDAARAGWEANPVARAARFGLPDYAVAGPSPDGLPDHWSDAAPLKPCVDIPCPPVVPDKTLGQTAYEAYIGFSGGKSLVTGDTLPSWEGQTPQRQSAWEISAHAVAARVVREA
jgi:hypothetical protein